MPGADKCIAKLLLTKKQMEAKGAKGLAKWCNNTMSISQRDYCPWLTGALCGSGKVIQIKKSGSGVTFRLTYTKEYAAPVHELKRRHNHGTMKFLATPFNLESYKLVKDIEDEMRGAL